MDLYHLPDLPEDELVKKLSSGAVMVYPTETVAGIGCIGSDQKAVNRVFTIKQRSKSKPVSYAFSSRNMIEKYVTIPNWIDPLLGLLPGPLTLVLPRKSNSPPLYGVDDTIGVRVPDMAWLLSLIETLDEPIISTSANISGQPPAHTVSSLSDSLQSAVDILIGWEGTLHGTPSTVVGLKQDSETIVIYRQGAIAQDRLYHLLD